MSIESLYILVKVEMSMLLLHTIMLNYIRRSEQLERFSMI
jgi:hypothetical protein